MAITNSERVGKALDVLKDGLRPFVERELKATYKNRWLDTAKPSFPNWQQPGKDGEGLNWDSQAILQVMCDLWNDCFKRILGPSERNLAFELRRRAELNGRTRRRFRRPDAYRAIDSVSAPASGGFGAGSGSGRTDEGRDPSRQVRMSSSGARSGRNRASR